MNKLFTAIAASWMVLTVNAQAFDPCNIGTEIGQETYTPISDRYEKGLFFKVSKCGQPSSYVLGTIHTDNPTVINKISYAFDLIARSKSASFETKFYGQDVEDQLRESFYQMESAETLPDVVGASYYDKFSRIIAQDYPEFGELAFYKLKPWAAAMITQYPKKSGNGKVMDEQLQQFALERGIEVHGIESGKELISFFTKLKPEEEMTFFRFSVDNYSNQKSEVEKLTNAYLEADLKLINKIADESMQQMRSNNILEGFEKEVLTKRNHKMAKRVLPYLKKGDAFVAVGALHLLGKEGVLPLLEEKGYYIEVAKTADELFEESLR